MFTDRVSATRVINVWHIGAWNRNVGDWAVAYSMHRLLNEQGRARIGVHPPSWTVSGPCYTEVWWSR
jgi:hypothetical protein